MQTANRRPARTLKQRAIALLARRDFARAELAARLAAAGGTRDEVEALLDELVRAGYVSDERFASAVVRHRQATFGRRAIAQVLREKGVDGAVAKEALAELDGVDEVDAALALWRRRFGTVPGNDREKSRQVRFLQARGFSTTTALKVLGRAGSAADEDGS